MIGNYFKLAWRNLMKNKAFSFINIFGLSIGLTCCMLILLFIRHEMSYDSYHKNGDRIYQVGTVFIKEGKEDRKANTPAPMAAAMQMEFPEIEKTTRLLKTFSDDKTLLQYRSPSGELKSFYEGNGYLADSTFFQVLSYHFKEGNAATSLVQPNNVVISSAIAEKMFGSEPALGKVIRISSSTNGDHDFTVSGVFIHSSIPTHIDAEFIMSAHGGDMGSFFDRPRDLASNNMFYTYLLLRPGVDAAKLERKFPAFLEKHAGNDLRAMGFNKKQFLVRLNDIHLHSTTNANVTPPGSVTYLYILASIAVFILLIACVNFMNLSTARSSKRSAEVGVRKVLGAVRSSLVTQFLGESIVMALISFILSIFLTILFLPMFGRASGKALTYTLPGDLSMTALFVLLALIAGLLAGSYPAFYLSSFKPVKVLKGKFSNSLAAVSLRKALVVFQFVISAGLIIAAVVIEKQMNYLTSKDLGFARDQQVIVPLRGNASKKLYTALKAELLKIPSIENTGASLYYPGIFNPSDMPLYKEGDNMNMSKRFFMNWVDNSYLQTLHIKPLAGRLFSPEFPADTTYRMVINAEGARQLGFSSPADAVGKKLAINWQNETYRWEIIGVVKDFHFKDLHTEIEPYGFQLSSESNYNYLIAHARPGTIGITLKAIEETWHRLSPNDPFEYTFLDDDFQKNYEAEVRVAALIRSFTIIAILICCLGLFGLATFSAEQRTKEIGVRKVLGASVTNIVISLSRDFLKLVALGIIIACPVAWYFMHQWLQNFAYRTSISWEVFFITAVMAIVVALVTISFQAIRVAIANPVKSLRTE